MLKALIPHIESATLWTRVCQEEKRTSEASHHVVALKALLGTVAWKINCKGRLHVTSFKITEYLLSLIWHQPLSSRQKKSMSSAGMSVMQWNNPETALAPCMDRCRHRSVSPLIINTYWFLQLVFVKYPDPLQLSDWAIYKF